MGDASKIEWTDATWNPVGGCTVASRGCEGCYAAERVAPRLQAQGHPVYDGVVKKSKAGIYRFTGKMTAAPDDHRVWTEPLKWRKPRRIFVCSTSDLFHESRLVEQIDRVVAIAARAPQHTFLLLTKRAKRQREYFEDLGSGDYCARLGDAWGVSVAADRPLNDPYPSWPIPNVWLGVSVEDQPHCTRLNDLVRTPAALRFVSVEPMLDRVDITPWLSELDWIIGGEESGARARRAPCDAPERLRNQCATAGIPFFWKQSWKKGPIPEGLQIRQWPEVAR